LREPTSQSDFGPSGFFALRTPLLPFDELLVWSEGLESAAAGDEPARLEAAFAADRVLLRQRLRKIFARPEVREALFLASPDLEGRFDLWLRDPAGEPGQKVERALVRYFGRMAGRATPFGLFAGCSVGTLGEESRLALAERARYRRHTRLDMDYLVLLTDAIGRDPGLQSGLAFGVNSSLYAARGRFRYLEVRRNGKGWTHHQVALEASDYLTATLARAREGAPLDVLAAALLEKDPDAAPEDAAEYLADLVENQILVSELRPAVTGPEPVSGLAARLRQINGAPHPRPLSPVGPASRVGPIAKVPLGSRDLQEGPGDQLEQIHQELEGLDAGGLGAEPARYRYIARQLEGLTGEVDLGRLFQVDMVKPVAAASVGPAILREIQRGVSMLHRLAPRDADRLAPFREAFARRYEGREVPLVEALDEDIGVGLETVSGSSTDASSLLDDLTFPKLAEEKLSWGRREIVLLRKLGEALASGSREIVLEPRDVDEMASPSSPPLPDAFAVMVSVGAASEAALAAGEFQVLLHGVSGPSGTRLLGRFCHADTQLHQWVQEHVRAEEALQADAVFAEIAHLPEGRVGNVLARPVLRAYEIPYLGRAGVPVARQIPVTDLLISVVGDQIVLRSARLGRRVLPRLTSAHNYHASQGIYRFLCQLQSQGTAGELAWDWRPLRDAPFLPRVVSGRLVLCRATWRLTQEELKPLGQMRGATRFREVQRRRVARRLPRWVALVEADNELPIDLDNVLAVDTFVELVKGKEQATLVELFPSPDRLWARGPEGQFVQELVVPFLRYKAASNQKDKETRRHGDTENPHPRVSLSPCLAVSLSACERRFPPGSEWLYAKLYAGPMMVDQILHDVVKPVVEATRQAGAADRWFFIRYGDPDWHLRLRFHGRPARLQEEVLPALQAAVAPLLEDGRLWRFQLDTYEREVERYGGPEGILLAERLFHADSEAVLALAALLPQDTRGDVRWRLALFGADLLLGDLGFDVSTRRAVLRQTRHRFGTEFKAGADLAHQLGAKFRAERKNLEGLLGSTACEDDRLAPALEVLRRRSESLAPVMSELKACAKAGRLSVPLTELAPSYLHMHANRLLRSAHRAQELVLYDFLVRHYESQAAQATRKAGLVALDADP
jgi:thiopeptide-type bacteriocin biosynthesis protein